MVPSLLRWVRCSALVKASRSAALSGLGRITSGPARKRAIGASPISEWGLRLYSYSTHACVASLRKRKVRSGYVLQHGEQPALRPAPTGSPFLRSCRAEYGSVV